jgi:hypothetical protein
MLPNRIRQCKKELKNYLLTCSDTFSIGIFRSLPCNVKNIMQSINKDLYLFVDGVNDMEDGMNNIKFIDQFLCFEPLVKATLSTKIGMYYYSCILGDSSVVDDISVNTILLKDQGNLEARGNLNVGSLLEYLREIHRTNYNSIEEAKILKRLQDIDKRLGGPTGHRVLEILANNIFNHFSQQHNKKYQWKIITDAKRSIKNLKNAKQKLLKTFEKELEPEHFQKLSEAIDGFMGKTNAVFTLWKTYGMYKAKSLPGTPDGSYVLAPRKKEFVLKPGEYDPEIRELKQPSKEMPFINNLVQEFFALLNNGEKYSKLEIAKIIEFFLRKLKINIPVDSIRKKLK